MSITSAEERKLRAQVLAHAWTLFVALHRVVDKAKNELPNIVTNVVNADDEKSIFLN
jgi:hypothetical protein